ncbi:Uncharacterised protein [Vibrio cholerae]|nr:Uncharacterised protein [Vibrio cholerae]
MPSAKPWPRATSKLKVANCSRPMMRLSQRPNKIAVDLMPIFTSSSRSTMAY